jgi:hypothetical protein
MAINSTARAAGLHDFSPLSTTLTSTTHTQGSHQMPSRRSYRPAFGSEQALLPATQSKTSQVLDLALAPPTTFLTWTLGRGSVVSVRSRHRTELRALSKIQSSGEFGLQLCSMAFFLLVCSLDNACAHSELTLAVGSICRRGRCVSRNEVSSRGSACFAHRAWFGCSPFMSSLYLTVLQVSSLAS